MIGAQYIAKFLKEKNIKHIFGYQGGAIAKILDEISLLQYTKYIQNYHEQASSLSASGYAKANNHLGVAIATSGPGAINILAGIADAYCDSVPCLFITGQDYLRNLTQNPGVRLNGFQDLDIVSIVNKITKYSVLIKNVNDLPQELEKCYWLATTGRKGPVLIDIPLDIQFQELSAEALFNEQRPIIEKSKLDPDLDKIKEVIDLLLNAKKPVILCGGGINAAQAREELQKLLIKLNIPVVATSNGLDIADKIIGFSGLHGNTEANLAILNSDVLLVLGARLGQRQVGKNLDQYTKAKIIHVDIDKNELGKIFKDSYSIEMDIKLFINLLNDLIKSIEWPRYSIWHEEIESYILNYSDNVLCNDYGYEMGPVFISQKILSFAKDDAIICLDVGQNQMWVSQAFKKRGSQRILSGIGYGSMGCSIPYAIGANYADNNARQIISFNGDGGFQMNLQELMLISDMDLNIKIIVFNNQGLGLIKEAQDKYMNSRHFGTNDEFLKCPNLKVLSQAYNMQYVKIEKADDFNQFSGIFNNDAPAIIEVMLDKNSKLLNKYDDYAALGLL